MHRIALDTRWIRNSQTDGIGRYCLNLLKSLVAEDCEFKFIALFDQTEMMDFVRKEVGESEKSNKLEMVMTPHRLFSPLDLLSIPLFLRKHRISLYHALNMYLSPFHFGYPVVLTVHDLIPVLNLFPSMERGSILRKSFFSFRGLINLLLKRSKKIISNSHHTKMDLIRTFNLPSQKIEVIYHGIQRGFMKQPLPEKWQVFCSRHGLSKPFILFVGRMERYKGIIELLRAYAFLPENLKQNYMLVIAGKKSGFLTWQEVQKVIEEESIEKNVLFLGHVEEEELRWLYGKAQLFCFPSFYEGFGFPVLEAMSSKTPVIAGNGSSIPEVAGDAAFLVDPGDIKSLSGAMNTILTDEETRNNLLRKGQTRVLKFCWENTAKQTLGIYKEVLRSCEL